MIAMGMVQPAIMDAVEMGSVLDCRVTIAGSVRVRHALFRRRVRCGDLEHMLVHMAAVPTMQMAVMEEVAMPLVHDRHMAAAGRMLMIVPAVENLM
jgi:hypothetical protein